MARLQTIGAPDDYTDINIPLLRHDFDAKVNAEEVFEEADPRVVLCAHLVIASLDFTSLVYRIIRCCIQPRVPDLGKCTARQLTMYDNGNHLSPPYQLGGPFHQMQCGRQNNRLGIIVKGVGRTLTLRCSNHSTTFSSRISC